MSWLRRLTIKSRFYLLFAITTISLVAFSVITIQISYEAMFEFKKKGISQIVLSSIGVINFYRDLELSGEISREEAQQSALDALEKMRFDNGNYINILTADGVGLMHPLIDDWAGKDMLYLKDKLGSPIIVNHVKSIKNSQGEGFNYYWWPKPGETVPSEKFSFNKHYREWDWLLSSGDFMDTIRTEIRSSVKNIILVLALSGMFLAMFLFFLMRTITSPLHDTVNILNKITGEKIDLTVRINELGKDEISMFSAIFNQMLGTVHDVIRNVTVVNNQLNDSSQSLAVVSERTKSGTEKQGVEMDLIVTAVDEMSSTVNEIARNTHQAEIVTGSAKQSMEFGRNNVADTLGSIRELIERINDSSDAIITLLGKAKLINKALDVINGIAEQTNLLALNASIEAARAGDQGRGFAVVAEEVRSLAKRVRSSTYEIDQIIYHILENAGKSEKSILSVTADANETYQKIQKIEIVLNDISNAVTQIHDLNIQISAATEQQATTTNEINRNLVEVNNVIHVSKEDVDHIKSSSDTLFHLAKNMRKSISRFVH